MGKSYLEIPWYPNVNLRRSKSPLGPVLGLMRKRERKNRAILGGILQWAM